MTHKKLLNEAKLEMRNIAFHATDDQWDNLKYQLFDLEPTSRRHCVYGLMTVHCSSDSALELIAKCANPEFSFVHVAPDVMRSGAIDSELGPRGITDRHLFTSLETYLAKRPLVVKKWIRSLAFNRE